MLPTPHRMWNLLCSMTRPHWGCTGSLQSLSQLFHQLADWLACVLGQQQQAEWQKAAEGCGGGRSELWFKNA